MTAVEWFYQRILSKDIKQVFEQAKAMEKEQIIKAYQAGDGDAYNLEETEGWAKQYYQETYGKRNTPISEGVDQPETYPEGRN